MLKNKFKILVVDDDKSIRKFLQLSLEAAGYELFTAESHHEALSMLNNNPDLIILDLNLPDKSGDETLKEIRLKFSTPVIMLTVEDSDEEKVRLLDAGADDYISKPFSLPELLARIRVIIRHAEAPPNNEILRIGDLEINFNLKKVSKANLPIKLTATEYSILVMLAKNPGKLISQEQLLNSIWGPHATQQSHYLRVYIGHLRKKIEDNPSQPRIIITETGIGYRLQV